MADKAIVPPSAEDGSLNQDEILAARIGERVTELKSWLASEPPLPTLEELARPILGFITTLSNINDQLEALAVDWEHDQELHDRAAGLLRVVRRTAELAEAKASASMVDGKSSTAAAVGTMIRALSGVTDVSYDMEIGNLWAVEGFESQRSRFESDEFKALLAKNGVVPVASATDSVEREVVTV